MTVVSDETTVSGPREALLVAAAGLLERGGPSALQARKLAAEIGASTMAVYTHFGGLPGLIETLVRDGFTRLAARLAAVPRTERPAVDLMRKVLAYRDFAIVEPHLYRLMFGMADVAARPGKTVRTLKVTPDCVATGERSSGHLIEVVQRVVQAHGADPDPAAARALSDRFWCMTHGFVMLEITGVFEGAEGVDEVLSPMIADGLAGFGIAPAVAAAHCREALAGR